MDLEHACSGGSGPASGVLVKCTRRRGDSNTQGECTHLGTPSRRACRPPYFVLTACLRDMPHIWHRSDSGAEDVGVNMGLAVMSCLPCCALGLTAVQAPGADLLFMEWMRPKHGRASALLRLPRCVGGAGAYAVLGLLCVGTSSFLLVSRPASDAGVGRGRR